MFNIGQKVKIITQSSPFFYQEAIITEIDNKRNYTAYVVTFDNNESDWFFETDLKGV